MTRFCYQLNLSSTYNARLRLFLVSDEVERLGEGLCLRGKSNTVVRLIGGDGPEYFEGLSAGNWFEIAEDGWTFIALILFGKIEGMLRDLLFFF